MQVTETLNEGLKRGYSITVPAGELDAKVDQKLEEARKDFQMKGFRKGKTPPSLMKKMFGKSVLGEAMQEAIDDAMREHFDACGDRPAMRPDVKMSNDEWAEGQDIEVSMTYEALPVVPEVKLGEIALERLVVEPDDAAVDEALESLASSTETFEPRRKGSKAKDGDQIVMDFKGSIDGVEFEGGAADDFPLKLGSNSFIPGFEDQLIGAKAEEEISVTVTFPEDYNAENLAGKEAVFACTVKEVKAPKAAEIDEELAKRYGAESLDGLKDQVKERLVAEYGQAGRAVIKRRLMDALDEKVSFDLPPSLVETEAKQIAHQLWHDENPEVQGHDHEEVVPTDEHQALATRRVRLGLLLAELGNVNKIEVSEQELQQAMFEQARQYPGQEREFFEFMQKNPQAQQQLRAPIFEDKVVDYILELAEVTDKAVSKDDLQKEIEALDDDTSVATTVE